MTPAQTVGMLRLLATAAKPNALLRRFSLGSAQTVLLNNGQRRTAFVVGFSEQIPGGMIVAGEDGSEFDVPVGREPA